MGGSARWRSMVVWTENAEGKKTPLRDENGNIVKVGVRQYTKAERKKLAKIQKNHHNTKTNPYKIDRGRMRRVLKRDKDDNGNKIPNVMTRDDEFTFMNEYNTAMKLEPEITADVKRISNLINAPLLGVSKRRKSVPSATQKRNRLYNKNNRNEMNDLIRFTHEVKNETFGRDVNDALREYRNAGYEIKQVKNFWTKPWAYKGINVTLQNKEGKMFEIQFHTKDSFAVKDSKKMHGLYEEQRKYKEGTTRYNELENEMISIVKKSIKEPVGVSEIKNINW